MFWIVALVILVILAVRFAAVAAEEDGRYWIPAVLFGVLAIVGITVFGL